MRFSIFKTSFLLFTILICQQAFSQKTGVGGAAIYNFQTKSFGFEARAEYPIEQISLLEGLVLAPQISYFPGFNKVHEFYVGTNIQLGVYTYNRWLAYGLTNISYNGWINHKNSKVENAKFSNLGFELGGGITTSSCIRPFFEYRYNLKWKEGNVRLGLIYTLKCNKRGQVPCPKIPDPPQF